MSALEEMATADPRVCAVANDSVSSAKLKNFKAKFPECFVNVGIAEQNMVGVGAGLANGGMAPYVCGASCFLTARALEQVKADLAYSKSNVKLCSMSPGMAYGQLGPTHHSIEDLAWMRVLPNPAVVVPADPLETAAVMHYSLEHEGPMFLRIARFPVPRVHSEDYEFRLGKAVQLRAGTDVTLIANGLLVSRALEAARALEARGIMAADLILAIDQGSTNTKALLVGREGRAVFRTLSPLEILQPQPGFVEQDLAGVPIVSMIGESHAALAGHGCYESCAVKATYGTGSSLMVLTPTPAAQKSLARTVAWSSSAGTRFALEGNIAMSSAAMQRVGEFLGATRNDALMQFQADILGRPVHRSADEDISALGAALLGGLALGRGRSFDDLPELRKSGQAFEPRMDTTQREQLRSSWRLSVARAQLTAEPIA
jgi:hypothetical protein